MAVYGVIESWVIKLLLQWCSLSESIIIMFFIISAVKTRKTSSCTGAVQVMFCAAHVSSQLAFILPHVHIFTPFAFQTSKTDVGTTGMMLLISGVNSGFTV